MKEVLYKAGYLIRIESWENDGDIKHTVEYHSADKEEADIIFEFANLFFLGELGNLCEGEEERALYEAEAVAFDSKYPGFLKKWTFPGSTGVMDDAIGLAEKLGLMGVDDYQFTRYADKIEVFHFENDVVVDVVGRVGTRHQ